MANDEWYTPLQIIEAARRTMGSIDLDPASCEQAQKTVKAEQYYTAADNGLMLPWEGNVWLNPPYSQPLFGQFVRKLVDELRGIHIYQACVLTNNMITGTIAGQALLNSADAVCFLAGRVRFIGPSGIPGNAPRYGQMICYFGPNVSGFHKQFGTTGVCF